MKKRITTLCMMALAALLVSFFLSPDARARSVQIELPIEKTAGAEPRIRTSQAPHTVRKSYVPSARASQGDGFVTERHIVVTALDGRGKVLYRRAMLDPRQLHVDDFLEKGGAKKRPAGPGKIIEIDSTILTNIPDNPAIETVHVYKPVWNGKKFDLVLLTSGAMPKKGAAKSADQGDINIKSVRGAGEARVTTIRSTGAPAERVDIVLLGDGYTASQMKLWEADAERIANELFKHEPFKSHEKFFNVHRVDLASAEPGAGWSTPFSRNNAFGSYYNCNNIARLLWLDTAHADRIINSVLQADTQDIKIVLVNDGRYGGGGGNYATVSARASGMIDIILHELGHSFAGLADEYSSQGYPCGDVSVEPAEPNVTTIASRDSVKWRKFADAGVFEGAKYCERGLFRPYENSKMRSLSGAFHELHIAAFRERIMGIVKSGAAEGGDDAASKDGAGDAGARDEGAAAQPNREFRYRGGVFVNTAGALWEARKDGGAVNSFREISRDGNYIYIRDEKRDLYLGLPIFETTDWFYKFTRRSGRYIYEKLTALP